MEKFADLHVHTFHSDGTFSPKEVAVNAKKAGLSCIAITDHDCLDGIAPARREAKKIGLEVLAGVEMTAQEDNKEVHILGFFPDLEDKRFLSRLKEIRDNRVQRVRKIIKKLERFNITLDPEDVLRLSGPGSVGRLHIAAVLEREGYVSSKKEAFRRFIGDYGPCYVSHYEISTKAAIGELRRVGAVVVYAHPHQMGGAELVPKFAEYGLDGIEAYHSDHSRAVTKKLIDIADKYGLLITGGSDCHGMNKGEMLMGRVKVPYRFVEELKYAQTGRRLH